VFASTFVARFAVTRVVGVKPMPADASATAAEAPTAIAPTIMRLDFFLKRNVLNTSTSPLFDP
jgi:hypothetical protein